MEVDQDTVEEFIPDMATMVGESIQVEELVLTQDTDIPTDTHHILTERVPVTDSLGNLCDIFNLFIFVMFQDMETVMGLRMGMDMATVDMVTFETQSYPFT